MKAEYERQEQRLMNYIVDALRQLDNKPTRKHDINAKVIEIMKLDLPLPKTIGGVVESEFQTQKRSDRTILRTIQKMVKRGMMQEYPHNLYSLTNEVESNIKYHAPQFGGFALANLMGIHWPTLFPLEANLKKLVEIFGVFLLYCFIEAARRVENVGDKKKLKDIWNEKDDLSRSWIQNVFSSMNMYEYFLATFQNQPSDREAMENNQRFVKDHGKYGPSIQDLYTDKRFHFLTEVYGRETKELPQISFYKKELEDKEEEYKPEKLLSEYDYERYVAYELPEAKIKRLSQALKDAYPNLYSKLLEARASFFGKPKERSQQQRHGPLSPSYKKKKPEYFDPAED
jgi:hypothetical protein